MRSRQGSTPYQVFTMAPIQKAIRDIQRCMKKKKEKGESTEVLEKRLALLIDDKSISEQIQKEKRNSAKYHMIKFIERQKLVRKIRSLDQQIAASVDVDSTAILKEKRIELMEKLAYVLYYPKEFKYVALFAETDSENAGKNEKLRLKAHKIAVDQWKKETAEGLQDRVVRVILCEDKEVNDDVNRSSGKKSTRSDDDEEPEESKSVKPVGSNQPETYNPYGDKVAQPKKKKIKVEKPPVEEVVEDFPAGQEPDSFFLEEEIIETKKAALQSINTKYPPENSKRNYPTGNQYQKSSSYGSFGAGNKPGGFSSYKGQNSGSKKPAYGSGSFSSFAPSKQSARLQKWQERKGNRF